MVGEGRAAEVGVVGEGRAAEVGVVGEGRVPEVGAGFEGRAAEVGVVGEGRVLEVGAGFEGRAAEVGVVGKGRALEVGVVGKGRAPEVGVVGKGRAPEVGDLGEKGAVKVDGAVAPELVVLDQLGDCLAVLLLLAALAQVPDEHLQHRRLDGAVVVHLLFAGLFRSVLLADGRLPLTALRSQVPAQDAHHALAVLPAVGVRHVGEGVDPGDPHLW